MSKLVTPVELAEQLGIPPRTLAQWRYLGRGPSYVKVGVHVRYRSEDIELFIKANTRKVKS